MQEQVVLLGIKSNCKVSKTKKRISLLSNYKKKEEKILEKNLIKYEYFTFINNYIPRKKNLNHN